MKIISIVGFETVLIRISNTYVIKKKSLPTILAILRIWFLAKQIHVQITFHFKQRLSFVLCHNRDICDSAITFFFFAKHSTNADAHIYVYILISMNAHTLFIWSPSRDWVQKSDPAGLRLTKLPRMTRCWGEHHLPIKTITPVNKILKC
jgi:hypothetical protein